MSTEVKVNPESRRSNVYDEAFWNKRFDNADYLYGTEKGRSAY